MLNKYNTADMKSYETKFDDDLKEDAEAGHLDMERERVLNNASEGRSIDLKVLVDSIKARQLSMGGG